MTNESLNKNQKIYIDENDRNELFNKIINEEYDEKYAFSSDCLERYCLGKTYLPDYAYSHIRSLLKKEFKEYCVENGINISKKKKEKDEQEKKERALYEQLKAKYEKKI